MTPEGELRTFYAAAYPRLVRVVTTAFGSRSDAEEAVQEAFLQLIPRWPRVRSYDDPEAWVRLVAFRLLIRRRRRARMADVALRRTADVLEQQGAGDDSVDVTRALASLSEDQRVVVVLHHLLDLPLEQIAAELRLPIGTVKSRLARARLTLSKSLALEEADRV